jgi:hypothetical protein
LGDPFVAVAGVLLIRIVVYAYGSESEAIESLDVVSGTPLPEEYRSLKPTRNCPTLQVGSKIIPISNSYRNSLFEKIKPLFCSCFRKLAGGKLPESRSFTRTLPHLPLTVTTTKPVISLFTPPSAKDYPESWHQLYISKGAEGITFPDCGHLQAARRTFFRHARFDYPVYFSFYPLWKSYPSLNA